LELIGQRPRAVDHRLVVAGEKPVRVIDFGDAHPAEILLEKLARRLPIRRAERARLAADLHQRGINRPRLARALRAGDDRTAARCESRERSRMVVGRPAVELVPGNWFEPGIYPTHGPGW